MSSNCRLRKETRGRWSNWWFLLPVGTRTASVGLRSLCQKRSGMAEMCFPRQSPMVQGIWVCMHGSRFPQLCYLNSYLLACWACSWRVWGLAEWKMQAPSKISQEHLVLKAWWAEPCSSIGRTLPGWSMATCAMNNLLLWFLTGTPRWASDGPPAWTPNYTKPGESQPQRISGISGGVGGFSTRGKDWVKETGSLTQWGRLGRNRIKGLENACFLLLSFWELIRGLQSLGWGEPWKRMREF